MRVFLLTFLIVCGSTFGKLPTDYEAPEIEDLIPNDISQGLNERQTRLLEEQIAALFESLRQLLITGNDVIPSFNPLVIGDLSLSLNNALLSGQLHLRNIILQGVPSFELIEGTVNIALIPNQLITLRLGLKFPQLVLEGNYESELMLFGAAALPGEGDFGVILDDLDVGLVVALQLDIRNNQLTSINELTLTLGMPAITFELTGLLLDDCLSGTLAAPLSEILSQLVQDQEAAINAAIAGVIQPIVDAINEEFFPIGPIGRGLGRFGERENVEKALALVVPTVETVGRREIEKLMAAHDAKFI